MKNILKLLPKRIIVDNCSPSLGPLMIRYYLTPRIFGLRLVIHHFLRSDNDRHYHDHPWNYISLILKGGYYEHTPYQNTDSCLWYGRWYLLYRPKEWKHWVELKEIRDYTQLIETHGRIITKTLDCWSLVLFYGRRRDWGFWTEKGWIKSDVYDCQ